MTTLVLGNNQDNSDVSIKSNQQEKLSFSPTPLLHSLGFLPSQVELGSLPELLHNVPRTQASSTAVQVICGQINEAGKQNAKLPKLQGFTISRAAKLSPLPGRGASEQKCRQRTGDKSDKRDSV